MPQNVYKRRNSIGGALIVVAVGVFFLILNLHPELNAWDIVGRYWPVLLIALGLGHMWDAWMDRSYPQPDGPRHHSGPPSGVLVFLTLFVLVFGPGRNRGRCCTLRRTS